MKNDNNSIKNKLFGIFMAYTRNQRGLSLENLASDLRLSYSMIRRAELGESALTNEEKNQVVRLFQYAKFTDNYNQLDFYRGKIRSIRSIHVQGHIEKAIQQIDRLLNHSFLQASYFFPYYMLLKVYILILKGKKIDRLLFDQLKKWYCFYDPFERSILEDLYGCVAYQNRKSEEAMDHFSKALVFDPDSFLAHYHFSLVAQSQLYTRLSLEHLQICQKQLFRNGSKERFDECCLLEALLHTENSEFEMARSSLLALQEESLHRKDREFEKQILNALAYHAFLSRDYFNCILYSKDSLRKFPDANDSILYLFLVFSYFREQDFKSMASIIENNTDQWEEEHNHHLILAIRLWADKKYSQAEEEIHIAYSEAIHRKEIDWIFLILPWLIELNEELGNSTTALNYANELLHLQQRKTIINM